MLSKFRKSEEGFTLIELLIVVAIIGILAAIAIPQFSAYRIRGYNAAANADLRNGRTTMEAFFSDWQCYPSSAADGLPAGTALYTNASAPIAIGATTINTTSTPSADTTVQFPVSANVGLVVKTSANGGTFTMSTKNASGDRCYGADSDTTQLMWVNGLLSAPNAVATAPAATSGEDFTASTTVVSPCKGTEVTGALGQETWVPLS